MGQEHDQSAVTGEHHPEDHGHHHGDHDENLIAWVDGPLDFCDDPTSCCLACIAPWHLFAKNQQVIGTFNSYSLAALAYAIPWIGLICLYGIFVPTAAGYEFDQDGNEEPGSFVATYPAASETLLTVGLALFVLMGIVGGYFRSQLRGKFKIKGAGCEDYCCHFVCPSCAIAQETRAVRIYQEEEEFNKDIEAKLHKEPLLKKVTA